MSAKKHLKPILILAMGSMILLAGLASCGPLSLGGVFGPAAENPIPTEPGDSLARVRELEIRIIDTVPVEVEVVAKGYLPNSCMSLGEVVREQRENTFHVVLFTAFEQGTECKQAVFPFEQIIPLDVLGLKAGRYSVDVNSVESQFEFLTDNQPAAATASIQGRLWHDLCAVAGGEGGVEVFATPECIEISEGSYRADGKMEAEEPAIDGVLVSLGVGACPSTGLSTAITDGDGVYQFAHLEAGTYCVSIDPLQGQNVSVMVPGDWTFPVAGSVLATYSVTVQPGEAHQNFNFGWDFQNRPAPPSVPAIEATPMPTATAAPTARPTPCEWVGFVKDVAVPDGTTFNPGAKFTKIWRIKNIGTCTWTTDYDLVFSGGDQMGGASVIALPGLVKPGESIDLSVIQTAPEKQGKFRGYWQLRNAQGVLFGLGDDARGRFWVDIRVEDFPYKRIYDFAEQYCEAQWQSGAGSLPCPGAPDGSAGFVVRIDDPALENRHEDEPTLWVHPNQDGSSWIQGTYPVFEVKEGDRFQAWVGCLDSNTGCDVQFELGYYKGNGNYKVVATWHEVYDGKVTIVNKDLSNVAGQRISFVLKMTRLNDQSETANGFWFVPHILRIARNIK